MQTIPKFPVIRGRGSATSKRHFALKSAILAKTRYFHPCTQRGVEKTPVFRSTRNPFQRLSTG